MKSYFWNEESFGSNCPSNWEEIAAAVNDHLEDSGLTDEEDLQALSEHCWEELCEEGEIFGIAPTRIWYAAMMDSDDQDWGTGSYDLGEAKTTVSRWRESGYPAAYIAIIDESGSEPMCIDEIHDF